MSSNGEPKPKTGESAKKSHIKDVVFAEIETVTEALRRSYILEVKKSNNEQLTEEEIEDLSEHSFNKKYLEKLNKMHHAQERKIKKFLTEKYLWTLMELFYLVRLAQQGFFQLFSAAYPAIEPKAIIYICDKMIECSIHARGTSSEVITANRDIVRKILKHLYEQTDEPVGEGFKTTYKQIMSVIHNMMDICLDDQNNQNSENRKKVTMEGQPTAPPVWVVMPYMGMIDNNTFAMSSMPSNLPIPSLMMHSSFPNSNMAQKFSGMSPNVSRSSQQHSNDDSEPPKDQDSVQKEEPEDEKCEEKVEEKKEEVDEEPKKQDLPVEEVREEVKEEQPVEKEFTASAEGVSTQIIDDDDNDDERFADPDDEDETGSQQPMQVEEIDYEDLVNGKKSKEKKHNKNNGKRSDISKDKTKGVDQPDTRANTSWVNFVAPPDLEGESQTSSPRSAHSGRTGKKQSYTSRKHTSS